MTDMDQLDDGLDLDARFAHARTSLVDAVTPEAPPVQQVRVRARRQRLATAVATVAVIGVVGVASLAADNPDDDRRPVVADGPDVDQPDTDKSALLAPGEVRSMAESPLKGRSTMASVWTGTEMIVWGGETSENFFADGAAYDPAADSWRMLAESPLSARNAPAAVWTGKEMILWGGHGPGDRRDGAAYNPSTDTWRTIADAPIASAGLPQAVWTGDEMVVVAGFNSLAAAAYDPAADMWLTLPAVPGQPAGHEMRAVWTGQQLVLRANYRDLSPSPDMHAGLFAYDPNTDRWTELPRTGHDDAVLTNIAFTGEHLLRVSQKPDAVVSIYDFASEAWTGIARWPADLPPMETSVWTGDDLLLWGGGDNAVLVDPDSGTLTMTPAGGGAGRTYPAAVWADGVLLIWGGFPATDDGIVLRPVNTQPTAPRSTVPVPGPPGSSPQTRTPIAGPDGIVGYLDAARGPVEVNGRLLPVQRVLDQDGNLVGYFGCFFLPREVVEHPDFDPTEMCSTPTTNVGSG